MSGLGKVGAGGGDRARLRIQVAGFVQGVGFRPYAHRLALSLGLAGFARNTTMGAVVEVEGQRAAVESFGRALRTGLPAPGRILQEERCWLIPRGDTGFLIETSDAVGPATALVLPDLATCRACVEEVFDVRARRHRYPFTNCTACGPRFSIVESVPYDRSRTSMRGFALCAACRAEYEDAGDRRFHAEPIACPACGPRLQLWDGNGRVVAAEDAALAAAAAWIREGRIVAVKALGGFQLLARADDEATVVRLRARKGREAKPLALMCASLEAVSVLGRMNDAERALMAGAAAPIVLIERGGGGALVAASVAFESPWLGIMLPSTPLHHLLMRDLGMPVVATSGNRSDEPICTDEREAVDRLGGIADGYLVHDRPIVRPVDDSVARVVCGREQVLRRARGYVPMPILVAGAEGGAGSVVAMGAHQKATVGWSRGSEVFLSQHLGDLETPEAVDGYERALRDMPALLGIRPSRVAADLHPDYPSTRRGARLGLELQPVAHHAAHAYACLADNGLEPPALALSWDGTGLGPDGTAWGGEFLEIRREGWRRCGWIHPFPLIGGDRAARDGRLCAAAALSEAGLLDEARSKAHLGGVFGREGWLAVAAVLGVPGSVGRTSSVGRLFDAVACLAGVAGVSRYEGEAAARLEWEAWRWEAAGTAGEAGAEDAGRWGVREAGGWEVDWRDWLRDRWLGVEVWSGEVAREFHERLAEAATAVAQRAGHGRVLLSGGCFQNLLLTECVRRRLLGAGFEVFVHQRVPPNDGGIALGQAAAVLLGGRWLGA